MWIQNDEGQMEFEVMYEEDLDCYQTVTEGQLWAALEAAGVLCDATEELLDVFNYADIEEF